jgi:hypothetical protein
MKNTKLTQPATRARSIPHDLQSGSAALGENTVSVEGVAGQERRWLESGELASHMPHTHIYTDSAVSVRGLPFSYQC